MSPPSATPSRESVNPGIPLNLFFYYPELFGIPRACLRSDSLFIFPFYIPFLYSLFMSVMQLTLLKCNTFFKIEIKYILRKRMVLLLQ